MTGRGRGRKATSYTLRAKLAEAMLTGTRADVRKLCAEVQKREQAKRSKGERMKA